MRVRNSSAAWVVVTAAVITAVRVDAQEPSAGPPPNIKGGAYQQLINRMWRDSPIFRVQCDRLAAEPQLTVVVRGESRPSSTGVRARGELSVMKNQKVSRVEIVIMSPPEAIELIAHEIEHVIERTEGVRLREQGCMGAGGRADSFESCRAVEAGRRVAREVQESKAVPTPIARQ